MNKVLNEVSGAHPTAAGYNVTQKSKVQACP